MKTLFAHHGDCAGWLDCSRPAQDGDRTQDLNNAQQISWAALGFVVEAQGRTAFPASVSASFSFPALVCTLYLKRCSVSQFGLCSPATCSASSHSRS